MNLPQPKRHGTTAAVLPRRREALADPTAAWDLLDELHRTPGILGSSVVSRRGNVVLSDATAEGDRAAVEAIGGLLAPSIREDVGQLGMGPLRMISIQARNRTVAAAPIGPGLLSSITEREVPLSHLRGAFERIQDELGRVELAGLATSKSAPASPTTSHASRITHVRRRSPVALDEQQAAEIVDDRGAVMVFVPGGTFLMGSDDSPDESPVHEVTVSPFLIDKYPVTNEEYGAFLEERPLWKQGSRNATFLDDSYLSHWQDGRCPAVLAQHPVVWISWWQALKGYCAWRGGRLPTESEWEFAGRGNDGRRYPWGNIWRNRHCNGYRYGSHWTSPVGEFPEGRSPFGVMDMSGNVWEWCSDWYAEDAYGRSASVDPTGPAYGRARVLRGGSRFNHETYLTLTKRLHFPPHQSDLSIGFRCVKPWPPADA